DPVDGDVGVDIAAAEEGGRACQVAAIALRYDVWADEPTRERDDPAVAPPVAGGEFAHETRPLGEAKEHDPVVGDAGSGHGLDDGVHRHQGRVEPWLVEVKR